MKDSIKPEDWENNIKASIKKVGMGTEGGGEEETGGGEGEGSGSTGGEGGGGT